MIELLQREGVYLWYYFSIQLEQIAPYWVLGIFLGSVVSVFAKDGIHEFFGSLQNTPLGWLALMPASLLGILSPLCMYGTIPIAASFSQKGMKDDLLAAFMVSSVLLNPQLLIYSAALGKTALIIRFVSCFLCGLGAGVLMRYFYKGSCFFNFSGFSEPSCRDTDPSLFMRLLKNIGRNIRATGFWFLAGIFLSALFQRYVPAEAFAGIFGGSNKGLGVLMAAGLGVPLYACGGGTIPLLQQWLASGMSMGSAAAFMISGPATKITNLGALKIVLGFRGFMIYLAYILVSALASGLLTDFLYKF